MTRRLLSQRQRARIHQRQARWQQELQNRGSEVLESNDTTHIGRIITQHGSHFIVADEHGQIHHCLPRQNLGELVCGDRVIWQSTPPIGGVVVAWLPRESLFTRVNENGRVKPLAANVSLMVIVLALEPASPAGFIDQYLVAAERMHIRAVLVVNKVDLTAQNMDVFLAFTPYTQAGYEIIPTSVYQGFNMQSLTLLLAAHASIFVGQSGVGKSSLIQALLPERDIQIGQLSQATGLGCHTTSATTWYSLPQGGAVIDSPGVRSFRLECLTRLQLAQGFREFQPYLGHCRFNDCRHVQEPGCALTMAADQGAIHPQRLAHFRRLAAYYEQTPFWNQKLDDNML